MSKINPFDYIRLIPLVLRLIDAIRLAAQDKKLSAEEIREVGEAFIAIVAAVVGKAQRAPDVDPR